MDLLVIVLAIGVGAFVKGVTGTGLPQIAIPVMAAVVGVERAVVVMAIPGVMSNAWLVWRTRTVRHETRDLPVLAATGIVGAALGTIALSVVDPRLLTVTLAVMILVYIGIATWRPHLRLPPSTTRWTSPPVGLVAGALQGGTGVSGPLLATYVHGLALAPQAYVLSLSVLFGVFSVVQVGTLAALGLYTTGVLRDSALALLPIAAMLPLGNRLSRRLPVALFRRLVLVGLGLTALVLLANAARL